MTQNLIGSYGPWAANIVGARPGRLSLRSGNFKNVAAWRKQATARVWDCLAAPELPATPKVRVEARGEFDGLSWERLSWQLPWGPRTDAVFLKPLKTKPGQRLPAILGLHDHGGKKYFGWRKIAQIGPVVHPLISEHRECYGGLAWANEAAHRGYAVLVHDTFPFGSRRVRVADVLPVIAGKGVDPADNESNGIAAYNEWAGDHEHLMAKSLFCAGTTWPGVYLRDDQAALSVLCARNEVDPARVACGGLSGGGMRTVFLAGLDPRVRSCFCAGFMTTWRDFLLNKAWTHTWMTYVPLLPRDLDFPEILGLRAPKSTLVLNCNADPLYTLKGMKDAGSILKDVYKRAGAADAIRVSFYEGGHEFNPEMQAEAFKWFERGLK